MVVGLIIDILVIGIIALFAFIGYKQGLVKVAIKLVSFFIAIIVAFALYKPVSNIIINNTQIDDNIQNTIIEKITPEGLTKDDNLPSDSNITTKLVDTANSSIETIANTFTVKLIQIVVFLLIFAIVRIALIFITALADLIAKLPIINQFNKLGGFIYGVLKGLLIVYIIFGLLLLTEPLIGDAIKNLIDTSFVSKFVYYNNILVSIIR